MNKVEFIRALRESLVKLPLFQQEAIINDYLEYFEQNSLKQISEEDTVKELGLPHEIAQIFYENIFEKKDLIPEVKFVKKNIGLFTAIVIFDFLIGWWLFLVLLLLALALLVLAGIIFYYFTSLIMSQTHLNLIEIIALQLIVSGVSIIYIGLGLMLFNSLRNSIKYHLNYLRKLIKGVYYEMD